MCQHTDFRKFELIGQSFSAFSASSLQDVSAVSSSHSLSEAVFLFSLTLFGLIGSEHLLAPPYSCFHFERYAVRNDPEACCFFSQKYALYNDIIY